MKLNSEERWELFHVANKGGRPSFLEDGTPKLRYWWISDHGRVKTTYNWSHHVHYARTWETGATKSSNGGYLAISSNHAIEKYVHRLVARFFIPNPFNKKSVNHKDGDKHNNHFTNLEWVTPSENMRHSLGHENYLETFPGLDTYERLIS